MEQKKYYIVEDGQKAGPYSKEELLLLSNIDSSTLIWTSGMSDWKPLYEFQELIENLHSMPPPIPESGKPDALRVIVEKKKRSRNPVQEKQVKSNIARTISKFFRLVFYGLLIGLSVSLLVKLFTYPRAISSFESRIKLQEHIIEDQQQRLTSLKKEFAQFVSKNKSLLSNSVKRNMYGEKLSMSRFGTYLYYHEPPGFVSSEYYKFEKEQEFKDEISKLQPKLDPNSKSSYYARMDDIKENMDNYTFRDHLEAPGAMTIGDLLAFCLVMLSISWVVINGMKWVLVNSRAS